MIKKIGLILGPAFFALILMLPPVAPLSSEAWRAIAMAAWMLTWWITEALPLPVTALLPMVLMPILGLADPKKAMSNYSDPIVYLFMGGFVIALAMERWGLHRRIALNILRLTGTNANGIIFGFFLATALISMWISNTATTIMMLPMALSVVALIDQGEKKKDHLGMRNFALTLMLGVSYASSIGGIGTLIGTPPNVVFAAQMKELFGKSIGFGQWMGVGVPYAICLLVIAYFIITFLVYPNGLGKIQGAKERILAELEQLGPMSRGEKFTAFVFCFAAIGWMFKIPIEKALPWLPLDESIVAILAALLLFVVPIRWGKDLEFALKWEDASRMQWGILLLFGGGLSLASALSGTGIIDLIGKQFAGGNGSSWLFLLGLVAVTVFLTELLSNVALVMVFIPVIGAVAKGMGMDPVALCIPVTLAASSGFMMPMSTPPNAIVFSSGYVTVGQMMRAGFWLNLVSILLMTILCKLLIPVFF
jgi:solute carrier family 13 (sodium-dependent dicarboxylate transporter), member 2/3/5